MNVKIGIAESSRVVEIEVDDAAAFEQMISSAIASDTPLVWVVDTRKNRIGIPTTRIGYVEIETDDSRQNVGFGM